MRMRISMHTTRRFGNWGMHHVYTAERPAWLLSKASGIYSTYEDERMSCHKGRQRLVRADGDIGISIMYL